MERRWAITGNFLTNGDIPGVKKLTDPRSRKLGRRE